MPRIRAVISTESTIFITMIGKKLHRELSTRYFLQGRFYRTFIENTEIRLDNE